ncbi:MAG: ABC transporter permease [Acidimicrobiales bacterium]
MFFFIIRRLLVSIPILLASSLLTFWLVTISGDPLAQYRQSTDPNREQTMATVRRLLELDRPFFERYVDWLGGLFRGDFGLNRDGQDVSVLLKQAAGTTFRLIIIATILSIVIGLLVGIITAVRQYSLLDYTSTFAAFLFFSLPVFWLAVLLKEFGAIKFNDYLEQPGLSATGIAILCLLSALMAAGLVGGSLARRAAGGAITAAVVGAILVVIDATDWLTNPGLSPLLIAVLALACGVLAAMSVAPLSNRRVAVAGVAAALVGFLGSLVLDSWIEDASWTRLFLLFVFSLTSGAAVGVAIGGEIDRRPAAQAGMIATFLLGSVVVVDRFISAWSPGRTIATIDPKTPNFSGTFWETMVDYAGHQILPSLALALIGFASYMRFTRASMLETLNSDYVRTAKAKGLPATQVVMRHAFRTALIPVMTVITISFATAIEGAVITERVFNWRGMGSLFITGLNNIDPYPIMAFLVVVSLSIVLLNAVADIMYAYLDPRIRR